MLLLFWLYHNLFLMHCRVRAFPQLAGLIVLGVGVWSIVDKHQFVALLATSTYALAAYTLVLAGGLVLLAGLAGCVALCRDNRCLLLVVSTKLQVYARKSIFWELTILRALLKIIKSKKGCFAIFFFFYLHPLSIFFIPHVN